MSAEVALAVTLCSGSWLGTGTLACYKRKGIAYNVAYMHFLWMRNASDGAQYKLYGVHGMSKKDETSVLIPQPSPKPLRRMTSMLRGGGSGCRH